MPDLASFCYGCPFCEASASSGAEFALHLEEHFLEGADRWLAAVLPRVVERPPVALAAPVPHHRVQLELAPTTY